MDVVALMVEDYTVNMMSIDSIGLKYKCGATIAKECLTQGGVKLRSRKEQLQATIDMKRDHGRQYIHSKDDSRPAFDKRGVRKPPVIIRTVRGSTVAIRRVRTSDDQKD